MSKDITTIKFEPGELEAQTPISSTDVANKQYVDDKVGRIIKQRKAIITIGNFTGSDNKSNTFSFQDVFGENFGSDSNKIHVQLTPFVNGNYHDMMMFSVRTLTSTNFIVNTRRVDAAGSSWGTILKAFCTVSQLA